MPTIILDTDFLSSFLKIERCNLIRTFYQIEQAFIPPAVHRELARTDLLTRLLQLQWIVVSSEEPKPDTSLLQDSTFQTLGAGERDCILLALAHPDTQLLMNDNKARQFAQSLGITVVNIPAFLLACKRAGLIPPATMKTIVQDLKRKDFYEFKSEIRTLLLK